MIHPSIRRWSLALLVALTVAPLARGEDAAVPEAESSAATLETITDAAAADHVGEECVVEFVVRAARQLADKGVCFLNSREDRRDEDNFTVVIFKKGLARFAEAGVENPADHFLDRRVRVRGVIAEHKDRPQIVVEDPGQIEMSDAAAE